MNNIHSLNKLISESVNEYNNEIVEVSNLKELYDLTEVSSVSGGSIEGAFGVQKDPPIGKKKEIEKDNKKQEKNQRLKGTKLTERKDDMISRKNILTERLMREYIRKRIKQVLTENNTKNNHEEQLRLVIRKLIAEGDISDVHPHRSTGINTLEDVLKKAIPTLRMDYKRLTTDKSQRESFRSHILNAVSDSLAPMKTNDQYLQGMAGQSSTLLSEPSGEDSEGEMEIPELDEANIEVDISDEEKKIPVEDDDTPSDEEQFGTGLEGQDETGRNMAFTSYKKISQYILDAYDSLANPKDKEVFTDYLLTNLKLYFDKFEDELQNEVEEPSSEIYDKTKGA